MPAKNKARKVKSGNNHYVSATGKRTNQGTMDSPWSLSHVLRGAGKRIRPGDTVLFCGGTYPSKKGMNIIVSGTPSKRITFKPCPGDDVRLDGAIPEFTVIGNTAWEPYEILGPDHNVYRSVKPYPISESYGGFIEIGGESYSLAPHKIHTYLRSKMHTWTVLEGRYLGPGLAQDQTEGSPDFMHLFIRLDNSSAEAQLDRPVPQIGDPDPRHHAIYVGSKASIGIKITGSHLVIEDFAQINHFGSCITMNTRNQTDITIRNCGGRPIYSGIRCGYTDHLILDSCKFHAHMPSDTWWVSYADIKIAKDQDGNTSTGEPVADHVRKVGLDLGAASKVWVVDCMFEEFFDGVLSQSAHHVEICRSLFQHTWDDAWQMNGRIHHIDFHHNLCYGAGPSVDAPGLKEANQFRGTVYIHHNVIDTTTRLLFWGRANAPTEGLYESIPFSSHIGDLSEIKYRLPRKLYYNTVVTGRVHDKLHPYVGWSLAGAAHDNLESEDIHEVYNNIFLVVDGRPGGRDFDAASGWEIYDGNVYWHYQVDSPSEYKSPWRFLHTSAGRIDGNQGNLVTVTQLRNYAPDWENAGLSENPQLNRSDYRPRNANCLTGAVNLTGKRWPGTSSYERWRGAVPPLPEHQIQLRRTKKARR